MTAPVLLSIDQGTSSVRATVLTAKLHVVASSSEAIVRSFAQPGWVDLDASALVDATERVARDALRSAGLDATHVAGVGLANQGETVCVWDRASGEPIAPAVVWQCRRTEEICARMRQDAELSREVRELTGLPIDAYFSATKLAWILDHVPGARARAERGELCAGTLDAFTIFRLTEGARHVTDPSTACRTLLADLRTGRFSNRLCEIFDVPQSMLPGVVSSDADLGSVRLGEGRAPLRAMLCDQPSALLGTGCLKPGDVKCTYGTGAFVQVNTGESPASTTGRDDGLLRSIAWECDGRRTYLLEGSVLAAGDVLTWLRDGLEMLARPGDVEAILESTPDSAGVLFMPALTGLGAPHWAGGARGTILGLHRGARRQHLIRAALEGIAHQVADVLDAAASAVGELSPMWADGGLSASPAFLQLQADLAARTLRRAPSAEATTRGVALIAGGVAGLLPSVEEAAHLEPELLVAPTMDAGRRETMRTLHHRLVELCVATEAVALSNPATPSDPESGGS